MTFPYKVNPSNNTAGAVVNPASLPPGKETRRIVDAIIGEVVAQAVDHVTRYRSQLPLNCIARIVQMSGHNPDELGITHIIKARFGWAQEVLLKVAALPEFAGILSEEDRQAPALKTLGKFIAFANTKLSRDQHTNIAVKYPNPVCIPFFRELAKQIQANKDHATTELAQVVCEGLDLDLDTVVTQHPAPSRVKSIRAWLHSPEMDAQRALITNLSLSHSSLAVLPDELRLFPQLQRLDLSCNLLAAEVTLSELSQLKELNLSNNERVTAVTLSGLPQLEDLRVAYNNLEKITLSNVPHPPQLRIRAKYLTSADIAKLIDHL